MYYDELGDLDIHGIIDQAIDFQRSLVYERDRLTSHPDIIQIMISGAKTRKQRQCRRLSLPLNLALSGPIIMYAYNSHSLKKA
jgi:hypothetical protein